jgi:thiol:disulfide interchange protein
LNTEETKKFIDQHGIVALRADKTHPAPEVDRLLEQLGNKSGSIPFYAIFPAVSPNKPILLDGVFTSPKRFLEAFEKAVAAPLGEESLAKSEGN